MSSREAWKGWHDVGAGMRADYTEFVALANEGARNLGFDDVGAMWRAGYDMAPEAFEADVERLWQQVKPLYDALHCYARARLAAALRQGQGARQAAHPGPAPRQHVGAAVEQDLRRSAQALSQGQHRERRCEAQGAAVGRGAHGSLGGALLHLAWFPAAAEDVLGALAAHAPARPRGRVSRERLGHVAWHATCA